MNRPGVGTLVILKNNNKVLLGRRKGSHGHGEWSFPGGHLELNETIEECGKRELFEETGIDISKLTPIDMGYTNDIFHTEKKHYITVYHQYNLTSVVNAEIKEPEKCFEWMWADVNNLPSPLFLCVKNYLLKNSLE
jgi:8-oxo-dGTP diphosphatase